MADTTDNQTQDEWNEETVYGPSTVIAALDQIEDLVESSRTVPLSASIMVNKAEILDLLDQAREALPEDLVAADAVVADADAVLGRADSAAETRIAEANSRASSTLDQANERAAQILADAEEEAERTRSRANDEATALVSQARSDAEATIADANAQAARIVSTENIVRMANDRADSIVAAAEDKAASLRHGADEYSDRALASLEAEVAKVAEQIRAGREVLAGRLGDGMDQSVEVQEPVRRRSGWSVDPSAR